MEQLIMYIINLLIGLADKHQWISIVLMVIGGLYVFLSLIRGFLTEIVKVTKTKVDDNVVATIFAFLDKYAWGFGKLAEYYEQKIPVEKKDK